jgi:uncharacterized protein YdcH (DUF465 family)
METTQLDETKARFLRLLELIERMNNAIERYRDLDEPDENYAFAVHIRQYVRLRDEYSHELLTLLKNDFHLLYQLHNKTA